MRGAKGGLWLRALAFSILSQGFAARVYCRALVNIRRCCFPGLNKLPSSLRWAISNYCGPGPIKRVAGCEAMQGQKGNLILSPDSAFMFLHTRPTYALGHSEQGILHTTFHRLCMGKGVLHVHQCLPETFRWLVRDGEVVGS